MVKSHQHLTRLCHLQVPLLLTKCILSFTPTTKLVQLILGLLTLVSFNDDLSFCYSFDVIALLLNQGQGLVEFLVHGLATHGIEMSKYLPHDIEWPCGGPFHDKLPATS